MKSKSFITIIFVIIFAAIFGHLVGKDSKIFGITFYSIFDVGGKLFLNLLMLVVVPLVFSSIISGMGKIEKEKSLGRIGAKTFSMFILTNLLAILTGVALVNIFISQFTESAKTVQIAQENLQSLQPITEATGIKDIFFQIIPKNIFKSFVNTEMVGIIFFSILFGYAITKIDGPLQTSLKNFFQGIFNVMLTITHMIIKLLPVGVFFLVAKEFALHGVAAIKPLAIFSMIELLAVIFIFFVIFPMLLVFIGKVNPISHMKAMFPAIVTAFSTSSSSATLPVTMECLEEKAKVSNKICSLVTPLGSSINLSATAMHIFVASAFIASAYGIPLNIHTQLTILLLTIITTLGIASVPSGCLMTLMIVITALKIPETAIAIIIAVDRILDMFRTTTNVFGVSSNAVIVAKLEGEKNILSKKGLSKK